MDTEELFTIVENITKYGLNPSVNVENKERDLEYYLVKIYLKYLEIEQVTIDYEETFEVDFDRSNFGKLRENIAQNFPNFGFYHSILNPYQILEEAKTGVGDAIDDLLDIIMDLLEIKWRVENHNLNDSLWYFDFIFQAHTQEHLINLLNFLQNKNK